MLLLFAIMESSIARINKLPLIQTVSKNFINNDGRDLHQAELVPRLGSDVQ